MGKWLKRYRQYRQYKKQYKRLKAVWDEHRSEIVTALIEAAESGGNPLKTLVGLLTEALD